MMAGERGIVSPRAARGLPKTFAGRMFRTWFYPGAGLGYVFLVCMFAAQTVVFAGAEIYHAAKASNVFGQQSATLTGLLLLCYLAFYVGLTRLAMWLVPRSVPFRQLLSVVVCLLLLGVFHVMPLIGAFFWYGFQSVEYGAIHAFNILWTLAETWDGRSDRGIVALGVMGGASILVFLLNLVMSTRDVMLVRISTPPRVREEEEGVVTAQVVDPFAD